MLVVLADEARHGRRHRRLMAPARGQAPTQSNLSLFLNRGLRGRALHAADLHPAAPPCISEAYY